MRSSRILILQIHLRFWTDSEALGDFKMQPAMYRNLGQRMLGCSVAYMFFFCFSRLGSHYFTIKAKK